jgi:5S rRNA maturation endonuclease (ribonuclease M5)
VDEADDGKVLLWCFAGCTTEVIVEAMGLTMRDLFPSNNGASSGERRIVNVYDYIDEQGPLLFQKLRYVPKDFVIRRPDGKGGFVYKDALKGVRRVLYRLPELVAAEQRQWRFIVEGEKDADALAKLDLVATTSPFGGSKTRSEKKWSPEFSEFFKGRRVSIIPDADETGRKFARHVAKELLGVAFCVKIIDLPGLPDKGDVSDWLGAGGTKEQLLALVECIAAVVPEDLEEADNVAASCACRRSGTGPSPLPHSSTRERRRLIGSSRSSSLENV